MPNIALTNGHGPQIGQQCPRAICTGRLERNPGKERVDEESGVRIRFLRCNKCGCEPSDNVQVVPLRYAERRSDEAMRVLRKDIPICEGHGPMVQYGRNPQNPNVKYYACKTCGATGKGLTREV